MILLPTRKRPENIKRFVSAYLGSRATLPVQLIIDEDDGSYNGLYIPPHWPVPLANPKIHDLNAAYNLGMDKYPDAEFYGIMADDIVPMTDHWDVKLKDACIPHYVAWGEDGIRQANDLSAPALCTHPFIGGELVRAWGWIMSPYTNRHCQDIIWKDFYKELNIGKYMPEVHTIHHHWQAGRADFDSTYASQPSAKEGHHQYHDIYKGSDQFMKDIGRVKEKLGL